MKRIVTLILVLGIVAAYVIAARMSRDPRIRSAPGLDPNFELFTIVGDAARRGRGLPGRWRESPDSIVFGNLDPGQVERLSELMTLPIFRVPRGPPPPRT